MFCIHGYRPATNWPQGHAGKLAPGDQRFSVGIEPTGDYGRRPPPGAWMFYTYWCEMKKSGDGRYWGNGLWPDPPVLARAGRWQCVEIMRKCNAVGDLLDQQVNLLIIDPFPPGAHDLGGIHHVISAVSSEAPFELPADKPLTLVAYQVSPLSTAYVEPLAVGDPLPDMPLFLCEDQGTNVPLEETYQATWRVLPREIRRLLEPAD